MGAGSSKVDADFKQLKSRYTKLKKDLKDLENSAKPSSSSTTTINYDELATSLTNIDTYRERLASALAENPDKLGESVSKISNPNTIQKLWKGLETNTEFTNTLAAKLSDSTTSFPAVLRGSQGVSGNITSGKEAVKKALYDRKYIMWCADGTLCQLPAEIKDQPEAGLQIGTHEIYDKGDLTFVGNPDTIFESNGKTFVQIGSTDGGITIMNPSTSATHLGHLRGEYDNYIRGTTQFSNNVYLDGIDKGNTFDEEKDLKWMIDDLYNRTNLLRENLKQHQHGYQQDGGRWGTTGGGAGYAW